MSWYVLVCAVYVLVFRIPSRPFSWRTTSRVATSPRLGDQAGREAARRKAPGQDWHAPANWPDPDGLQQGDATAGMGDSVTEFGRLLAHPRPCASFLGRRRSRKRLHPSHRQGAAARRRARLSLQVGWECLLFCLVLICFLLTSIPRFVSRSPVLVTSRRPVLAPFSPRSRSSRSLAPKAEEAANSADGGHGVPRAAASKSSRSRTAQADDEHHLGRHGRETFR